MKVLVVVGTGSPSDCSDPSRRGRTRPVDRGPDRQHSQRTRRAANVPATDRRRSRGLGRCRHRTASGSGQIDQARCARSTISNRDLGRLAAAPAGVLQPPGERREVLTDSFRHRGARRASRFVRSAPRSGPGDRHTARGSCPYLFERFRSGDHQGRSGLGLGLAIARHIVELHSGTITAHSEGEGRGSTFTVELPVFGPHIDVIHGTNERVRRCCTTGGSHE